MTHKKMPQESETQTFPAQISGAFSKSIAVKLAAIITAVIVVGMGLLSLFILGNQNTILDQQTDSYASALGDQLSAAAIEPVLADDLQAVDQLIANLADNEGIEGVAIFSDQATLLSTIGIIPPGNPTTTIDGEPLQWSLGEDKQTDLTSYISTIRFRNLVVGYCIITFDRSFMGTAYGSTLRAILLITLLMVVLGIVVAIFIGRRLSRPVQQLVNGTQEISHGNYGFRFKERRKDELGQLMNSLNTMTEGLSQKEQVEQVFSRFVSPNVASTLLEESENRLGGNHVNATVLFADISGFTTLSENLNRWLLTVF